jgi:hypothetical protein
VFGFSSFAASPFASLAGIAYNSAISETGTATDAVSSLQTFLGTVAETGTATDAVGSLAIFYSVLSETSTATDAVSSKQTFVSAVTETGTATDSTVGYVLFPASVAETATASDAISSSPIYLCRVAETATATDAILSGFLWNIIDDAQTPNWVLITSTQTPGWTAVDTRIFINYTVNTVISSNTSVIGVVTIFPNVSLTVTSVISFTIGPANSSGNDYATDWTVIGTVN